MGTQKSYRIICCNFLQKQIIEYKGLPKLGSLLIKQKPASPHRHDEDLAERAFL